MCNDAEGSQCGVASLLLAQNMYIKSDGTMGAGVMQGKRMRTAGGYSGSQRSVVTRVSDALL